MSATLEIILDKYVKLQENVIFRNDVVLEDKEAFASAVKKDISDKIYNEIQDEMMDTVLEHADELIEKRLA